MLVARCGYQTCHGTLKVKKGFVKLGMSRLGLLVLLFCRINRGMVYSSREWRKEGWGVGAHSCPNDPSKLTGRELLGLLSRREESLGARAVWGPVHTCGCAMGGGRASEARQQTHPPPFFQNRSRSNAPRQIQLGLGGWGTFDCTYGAPPSFQSKTRSHGPFLVTSSQELVELELAKMVFAMRTSYLKGASKYRPCLPRTGHTHFSRHHTPRRSMYVYKNPPI